MCHVLAPSPDLAPSDLWPLLNQKSPLNMKFQSVGEIKKNVTNQLKAIQKEHLVGRFEKWVTFG